MLHPGKCDWWIAGLLAVVAAAMLVGGGTLLGVAAVGSQPLALIPGAALLLTGGMIVWVLRGTNCEITATSLVVRSGPFRWTVPLDAITEVVPAGFWSGPAIECNFGLAVQGLRLRYRTRSGRLSWPIRIAPRDRAAFLLELSERLPGLVVKEDGSLRRPAASDALGGEGP